MPRYEIEIKEQDGTVTRGTHTSPDEEWYDTGHAFDHEGRMLRVALVEEPSNASFDQRLICTPQ
jgi:hypothetical protein